MAAGPVRESAQAQRAYLDYQAQAPPRSLERLAQTYQTYTDPGPPTRHVATLKEWSRKHAWAERIAAYERKLAEEAAAADADERRKARKARLGISYEAQDKVLRKLRATPAEQLSVREAVALLRESWDAQRKDLGEPDQLVQVAGQLDLSVDVRSLSSVELDAYVGRLQAAISAGGAGEAPSRSHRRGTDPD